MRKYNRPYFQTKQYWGLVEILSTIKNNTYPDKTVNFDQIVDWFIWGLKTDNPKFKKELFLKALNGDK